MIIRIYGKATIAIGDKVTWSSWAFSSRSAGASNWWTSNPPKSAYAISTDNNNTHFIQRPNLNSRLYHINLIGWRRFGLLINDNEWNMSSVLMFRHFQSTHISTLKNLFLCLHLPQYITYLILAFLHDYRQIHSDKYYTQVNHYC